MSGNQSLERGLAILDLLNRAAEPIGIREIARELELSPAIVQRLANTLAQSGLSNRLLRPAAIGWAIGRCCSAAP